MTMLIRKRTTQATIFTVFALTLLWPQAASSIGGDAGQIARLMAELSDHSKAPTALLDPGLGSDLRLKNLKPFSSGHYELSIAPKDGIPAITGQQVSVPVHVRFKSDGNELETDATANFINRNGSWYFADFDFLGWPTVLIVAVVGCLLVGIGYATVALVLIYRLQKRGPLGANVIKVFLPFFWRDLFRQTRAS